MLHGQAIEELGPVDSEEDDDDAQFPGVSDAQLKQLSRGVGGVDLPNPMKQCSLQHLL